MSEQKPGKIVWKALLGIWLCGALIYLQMGGVEELQTLWEQRFKSSEHAAVDAGPAPKQQPAPQQRPAAQQQQAAAPQAASQQPAERALPAAPDKSAARQSAAGAEPSAAHAPSFDVARAESTGDLVIAGKAEPDWTVRLRSGGKVIGETQADSSGSWVMTPDKPLSEGAHTLELSATSKDGKKTVSGVKTAEITVPKRKTERPAVARADEPTQTATQPKVDGSKVDASKPDGAKSSGAQLAARDASREDGAGNGAKEAAKNGGKNGGMNGGKNGKSGVKTSARSPSGAVGSTRGETDEDEALEESGGSRVAAHEGRRRHARKRYYTVNRGDTLWRIAKRYYGAGASYTKIYRSNRDQIDDPDLIYPNQRFSLSR